MQHSFRVWIFVVLLLALALGGSAIWHRQLGIARVALAAETKQTAAPDEHWTPSDTPPARGAAAESTEGDSASDGTKSSDAKQPANARLSVFGHDLFSGKVSTFEPNPDTPVPADYVLGSGDTLSILCWQGTTEYERTTVSITPSGDLYLKLLGRVPLADRTLAQAQDDLQKRYSRFYAKFSLSINVVGRRTIPVYVMGEVGKPGKYLLSSLSTVFTALYAAGGPTDLGSLRTIQVLRNQRTIADVDVYAYLLQGKMADIPLKSGDTIFVPLATKIVAIDGEVRRPAKYELLDTDTLAAALDLAGGLTAASTNRIRLARTGPDKARTVTELLLPADNAATLQDGDELMIAPVLSLLRNAVIVEGRVNRPGSYSCEQAPTVAALLTLADGVTPDAYILQAFLYRFTLTGKSQMISINLEKALADDPKENLTLRPLDRLVVQSRQQVNDLQVSVEGGVNAPGRFPYYDGMRIVDALLLAGGAKPDSALDRALLIRRNPTTYAEETVDVSLRSALARNEAQNLALRNGDRLVVFPKEQLGENQYVTIDGAVEDPGAYPYMGNMRVSQLVFLGRGLKTTAYMRRAELYRLLPDHTEQIIPVDLTQALAGGMGDENPVVQPRDRLVISTMSDREDPRVVKIDGYVRTPSVVPFTVGLRVSDALTLAGGLKPDAQPTVDVFRQEGETVNKTSYAVHIVDGRIQLDVDPFLHANDLVSVQGNSSYVKVTDTVMIEGEVKLPGTFPVYDGTRQTPKTLYQALAQAGGLLPDAYAAGVVLYRQQSSVYTAGQQWGLNKTTGAFDALAGIASPKAPATGQSRAIDAPKTNETDVMAAPTRKEPVGGFANETRKPVSSGENTGSASDTPAQPNESAQDTGTGTPMPADPAAPATTAALSPTVTAESAQQVNINNITRSIAQVISTGKDSSVVLVIPPRSMSMQDFSLSLPVNAERIISSKGKEGDIMLEPGDIVYVPKRPTTVTVLGGVIANGAVMYQQGKSVEYYLNSVGGIAQDGDHKHTVIMRVNGQILPLKNAKGVQPGDVIIVPTKHIIQAINTQSSIERVLSTMSQLALTALPFIR